LSLRLVRSSVNGPRPRLNRLSKSVYRNYAAHAESCPSPDVCSPGAAIRSSSSLIACAVLDPMLLLPMARGLPEIKLSPSGRSTKAGSYAPKRTKLFDPGSAMSRPSLVVEFPSPDECPPSRPTRSGTVAVIRRCFFTSGLRLLRPHHCSEPGRPTRQVGSPKGQAHFGSCRAALIIGSESNSLSCSAARS
jgi:hypothetical protein